MDTSDSDYGGNSSILDSLLEKAELQGHLTMEDLEEIIPRSGASTETLDELVIALNDQGVQVLCQEDEEDETDEDFDDAESVISYSPASSHAQSQSDDSITLYLREMSQVPLLNKEQEVSLAKSYEAGREAQEKLIKMGENYRAEERLKLEQIVEDGRLAREHLI
ncbi:MAG: RNA polymerase subunit sigma, partial [Pelolinea sp.]|nr:RNA polymerase subunit sigma [Pelolinea sp.]